MENSNWEKIEFIIDEVLEMPKNQRQSYINTRCGNDQQLKSEVMLLLKSIFESEGWLNDLINKKNELYENISDNTELLCPGHTFVGTKIGSYTIRKKIAEGGMGEVYLAERTDGSFEQCVAIKIMRHGTMTRHNIRRFRQEERILAGLHHPGIAQLYDGGVTPAGFPYFIMEYIDGLPIDEYCRKHARSIDQKVLLFKKVLEAVRYAHENLVIHRDLKPENILINREGHVKILDFGISKLLGDDTDDFALTRTGVKPLTPRFAAPEQIKQQKITTATDLYALGVIFYEVLAGCGPFNLDKCSRYEIEQIILKQFPLNPSIKVTSQKLQKKLQGDLDAITLKALRKEPDKRYRTAPEMLDDLENYQKGIPVSAHDDSLKYRSQKFFERHRQGVTVIASIILLLTGMSIFYAWRITNERNLAKSEAAKAKNISNFLMSLFEAKDPAKALGDTVTANMLLHRGVLRARDLKNQPKVQAQMFDVIGQVYRRLGQYEKAQKLLQNAINLKRLYYGSNSSETALSINHLGLLLCDMSAYKKAETLLRKNLTIQRQYIYSNQLLLSKTQALLAYALRRQGNYNEAEMLYRHSLSIRREQLDANNTLIIESLSSLGATLHNKGDYKEAEQLFREALEKRRNVLGPVHPDIAMSLNNLGTLLMNKGKFNESELLLKESLHMRIKIFGNAHPKVALSMNNLALLFQEEGKFAAAGSLFHKSLLMRQKLLSAHHIATTLTLYCIAGLMIKTHRPDSALKLYNQVLPIFLKKLSSTHSFTARSWMGMGTAYLEKGNIVRAKKLLNKGFGIIKQIHAESSIERALAEKQMGNFLLKTNHYAKAESLLNHSYHSLQSIEGFSSRRQQSILSLLNKN